MQGWLAMSVYLLAGLVGPCHAQQAPTPQPHLTPLRIHPAAEKPSGDPNAALGARCTVTIVTGYGARCLATKHTFKDCFTLQGRRICGPQMVVIPPGRTLMESPESEQRQHEVAIPQSFAVAVTHVTRGHFADFVTATDYKTDGGCRAYDGKGWRDTPGASWRAPGFDQDDRHPVVCINWNDALAYARWLKQSTGFEYRLLTDAEAEYIARASMTAIPQTKYSFGNDEGELCKHGNGADVTAKAILPNLKASDCKDGFVYTAPGGQFPANAFGVKDVHGNARTWVQDCWTDRYAPAPPDSSCKLRVLRGGAWSDRPRDLQSKTRTLGSATLRLDIYSFRIARTLASGR